MASTLNPYISFKDTARDAMTFYKDVFGGELSIMTFGDMNPQDNSDQRVMHAQLTTPSGFTLMASDTPDEMPYTPGASISVSLSGDDADELRGYWDKLSDGGQVMVPLEKQMWGDEFGMLTDKHGIAWMVNIAGSGE